MTLAQWKIESPFGPIFMIASDKGLVRLSTSQAPHTIEKTVILAQAAEELTEYFDGKRKEFSVPLDLQGTAFQKKVWAQLMKIPYGKTVSYRDIANQVDSQNAVRAVGSANGKNPVWIIVPCHRVINANGKLGGYAGGLTMKIKLLELEQSC